MVHRVRQRPWPQQELLGRLTGSLLVTRPAGAQDGCSAWSVSIPPHPVSAEKANMHPILPLSNPQRSGHSPGFHSSVRLDFPLMCSHNYITVIYLFCLRDIQCLLLFYFETRSCRTKKTSFNEFLEKHLGCEVQDVVASPWLSTVYLNLTTLNTREIETCSFLVM